MRRAQVSYVDFTIGMFVFFIGLLTFMSYAQSASPEPDVRADALSVSAALLSQGVPSNWTQASYFLPGIVTDGQIDPAKWNELSNLAASDPEGLKAALATSGDFMLRLTARPAPGVPLAPVASLPDISTDPSQSFSTIASSDAESIERLSRIVAYNDTVVRFEVVSWR